MSGTSSENQRSVPYTAPGSGCDSGVYPESTNDRWRQAGPEDLHGRAIEALFRCSGGFPRVINVLADNALLLGYAREKKKISPTIVEECHRDLQIQDTQQIEAPTPGIPVSSPVSARKAANRRLWVLTSALVAVLFLFVLSWSGRMDTLLNAIPRTVSSLRDSISEKVRDKISPMPLEASRPMKREALPSQAIPIIPKEQTASERKGTLVMDIDKSNQSIHGAALVPPSVSAKEKPAEVQAPQRSEEAGEAITVKQGDTVTELAIKVYGFVDEKVLDMLKVHNPTIPNLDFISIGQKITFPPLSTEKIKYGLTYTVHVASFKPFEAARAYFQKMVEQGYEPYIIPVYDAGKGKIYRVTLANFESREKAQDYAKTIIEKGISDYATPVLLEMK